MHVFSNVELLKFIMFYLQQNIFLCLAMELTVFLLIIVTIKVTGNAHKEKYLAVSAYPEIFALLPAHNVQALRGLQLFYQHILSTVCVTLQLTLLMEVAAYLAVLLADQRTYFKMARQMVIACKFVLLVIIFKLAANAIHAVMVMFVLCSVLMDLVWVTSAYCV